MIDLIEEISHLIFVLFLQRAALSNQAPSRQASPLLLLVTYIICWNGKDIVLWEVSSALIRPVCLIRIK